MKRTPLLLVLIGVLWSATATPAVGQKEEKERVSGTISVKAKDNRVASGFQVAKGEWLELEIKGKWRMWDRLPYVQAEGHTNMRKINQVGHLGALLCQIGQGPIFTLANRLPFQANASGEVFFGPNRGGWLDSQVDGELVIVIRTGDALKEKREKGLKDAQEEFARLQADPEIKGALALVNSARKACGLEPVELAPELSQGCNRHAHYLVLNKDNPLTQGLKGHEEYEELKGYTAEGAKAGRSADISFGPAPTGAAQFWIASLYHRIPLLQPRLRKIGIGYDSAGQFHIVVADCLSAVDGKLTKQVVYCPEDQQKDVWLAMGPEFPRPLPASHQGEAGFPITVGFLAQQKVTGVTMTLADAKGNPVKAHLSAPAAPATTFPQQNTVCLIPDRPLQRGMTYQVELRCQVNGTPLERSWRFTTTTR